ncbi:MAG: DUF456 domain-containing protein [Nocardioidaceae bacterium]
MSATVLVSGLLVATGLVGVVVPVLPGSALVWSGVALWAWQTSGTAAWAVLGLVTALLAAGAVVKYAVPGRRLRTAGVPATTLLAGALLGIVGFFVVPLVGLPLGFVLGVYLVELRRVGPDLAWPATRSALGAAGLSLLIELGAALLAAGSWLVAAVVL